MPPQAVTDEEEVIQLTKSNYHYHSSPTFIKSESCSLMESTKSVIFMAFLQVSFKKKLRLNALLFIIIIIIIIIIYNNIIIYTNIYII